VLQQQMHQPHKPPSKAQMNFFGLVNKDGKLVFGISTSIREAMNSEIDYQITVSAAAISAVKTDGNDLDNKYTKTLLDYINNNRATIDLSGSTRAELQKSDRLHNRC
jgi:hypothetical protein